MSNQPPQTFDLSELPAEVYPAAIGSDRDRAYRRQAAVAAFSRRAVAPPNVRLLIQDAAAFVAETLSFERFGIAELSEDRSALNCDWPAWLPWWAFRSAIRRRVIYRPDRSRAAVFARFAQFARRVCNAVVRSRRGCRSCRGPSIRGSLAFGARSSQRGGSAAAISRSIVWSAWSFQRPADAIPGTTI